MFDTRPSEREICKKLQLAKHCLANHHVKFSNLSKVVGELYKLNIGDSNEIWTLIKELLDEITHNDYCGSYPPQRSYEKIIKDEELFAFSWLSKKLDKKMYIKFVLKKEQFYYVSLHESTR